MIDQKGTKLEFEQDLIKNQIVPINQKEKAHSNSIESLATHPNQKIFASGSHDKLIKLWDASTLKETMTLADHKEGVWSLDYSKDGNLLVSGSPDKSVLVWDSKKSSPGIKISAHKDKVYVTRFNQTGKLLASGGQSGQLFIWDIAKTKEPVKKLQVSSLVVYDIEWSKDETSLLVSTLGSQIISFDAKNFNQTSSDFVTQNDHESRCESCAINFKLINHRVFVATSRGKIAWYQHQNGQLKKQTQFLAHFDACRTVNYHPTKKVLLSSGKDGSVRLWDASSDTAHPSIIGNLVLHKQNVAGISFLGGQHVITGSWDQRLALWKISDLLH